MTLPSESHLDIRRIESTQRSIRKQKITHQASTNELTVHFPTAIELFGGPGRDAWALVNETVFAGYARQEVPEPVDLALPQKIKDALARTELDWRTPSSLAKELGATENQVRRALFDLGGEVRNPITPGSKYADWYRLSSKSLTRNERLARIKAVLTGSWLGDF